jgi:hypothetical protein
MILLGLELNHFVRRRFKRGLKGSINKNLISNNIQTNGSVGLLSQHKKVASSR